jgi:hypothetical protein
MPPIFTQPAFWRGCAKVHHEFERRAIYEQIARDLEAGRSPSEIPAIGQWMQARVK